MNPYDGVEDLRSFSLQQLSAYRAALLGKTQPQINFINRWLVDPLNRPISVVEVGTGNGRLLIGMSLDESLSVGCGIDVSASRIKFAQDWYNSLSYTRPIRFRVENVLTSNHSPYADLAVCITGCFNYFRPMGIEAPLKTLKYMRETADYGLFELYKMPPKVARMLSVLPDEYIRTWDLLPESDPWRYYLHGWLWDDHLRIMTHDKYFIADDGRIDNSKSEQLYYYSLWEFEELLREAGYKEILYSKENSTCQVILAK